jgi:hypothetical protein
VPAPQAILRQRSRASLPNARAYTTRPTTVIRYFIRLDPFRGTDTISPAYLNKLNQRLSEIEANGLMVILAVAYNFQSGGADVSPARALAHIDQYGPIVNAHRNILYGVNFSTAGPWGEGHNSRGADNVHSADDLVGCGVSQATWLANPSAALYPVPNGLDCYNTPNPNTMSIFRRLRLRMPDSYIQVRFPQWLREWENGRDGGLLTGDKAHTGFTDDYAINDQPSTSTLYDAPDGGTWSYWGGSFRSALQNFARTQVATGVPMVGESDPRRVWATTYASGTPGSNYNSVPTAAWARVDQARVEFARYGWSVFHNPQDNEGSLIPKRFRMTGVESEIGQKLGYRLHVRSVNLPSTISKGPYESITGSIEVENSGYSAPLVPGPVQLTLRSGFPLRRLDLGIDRTALKPGITTIPVNVIAPSDLPEVAMTYGLALPHATLTDARYAIQTATQGVTWVSGTNDLGAVGTVVTIPGIQATSDFETAGLGINFLDNGTAFDREGLTYYNRDINMMVFRVDSEGKPPPDQAENAYSRGLLPLSNGISSFCIHANNVRISSGATGKWVRLMSADNWTLARDQTANLVSVYKSTTGELRYAAQKYAGGSYLDVGTGLYLKSTSPPVTLRLCVDPGYGVRTNGTWDATTTVDMWIDNGVHYQSRVHNRNVGDYGLDFYKSRHGVSAINAETSNHLEVSMSYANASITSEPVDKNTDAGIGPYVSDNTFGTWLRP